MIFETFKKRKHVREFDTDVCPPRDLIDKILKQTLDCTPSKQNFMPYNIFVFGPDEQLYKDEFHRLATYNEHELVDIKNPLKSYKPPNPEYNCLLTAPYVLLFCKRWEDKPNKWQQEQWDKGKYLEAMSREYMSEHYNLVDQISLEIGLLVSILTGFCMENNLDVSYTSCFARQPEHWKHFPFIIEDNFFKTPIVLVRIGKSKKYRIEGYNQEELNDQHKPDFERIIKYAE